MENSRAENYSTTLSYDQSNNQSYILRFLDAALRLAEGRTYVSILWTATIITAWVFLSRHVENPVSKLPLVTPVGIWDIGGKKARERFMANARSVVEQGFKQVRYAGRKR